jgi:hypothetical protein
MGTNPSDEFPLLFLYHLLSTPQPPYLDGLKVLKKFESPPFWGFRGLILVLIQYL